MIISGGENGSLGVFDVRNRRLLHTISGAHEGGINTLALHPNGKCFLSGCSTGDLKLWSLPIFREICHLSHAHGKSSFFEDAASAMALSVNTTHSIGVTDSIATWNAFYSCGADGTIRRFQTPKGNM